MFCVLVLSLFCAGLVAAAKIPLDATKVEKNVSVPDVQMHSQIDTLSNSYQLYPRPREHFELPRAEPSVIPFQQTDLSSKNSYLTVNNIPFPSQDLVAPVSSIWNPNNDNKLYFNNPESSIKQTIPNKVFPKKFNSAIHTKQALISKKKMSSNERPQETLIINEDKLNKNHLKPIKNKVNDDFELLGSATDLRGGFVNSPASNNNIPELNSEIKLDDAIPYILDSASNPERIEYHMVGHDGPKSYKWGYDTGKGRNRQFRFEERDNDGTVKGHYGFFKNGKLQMVKYDAHPDSGFHAENNFGQ